MSEGMFENLSNLQGLDYIVANSPQELLDLLRTIRLPTRIVALYAIGSRHIAWVQTTAKIRKTKPVTKQET